jgi:putative MATE family efflux protein
MLYQLAGGLINVAANVIFVWALGWGVRGSAFATLLSQTAAALLVFRKLTQLDVDYRLTVRRVGVDLDVLKKILYIGLPAGIQSVVITLSNLIVQYHINYLGVNSVAAFTAYFKVEQFIYLPIMAFGQAMTTFSGQNFGAGETERVKQGVKKCILIGVLTAATLSFIVLLFSTQAFGLFSTDREVIEIGRELASITFPFYFLYVILEILTCSIRGVGKSVPPMVMVLMNLCVLRTALIYVITNYFLNSAGGVVAVYPITWACAAACLTVYYRKGNWMPQYPNRGKVSTVLR